MNKIKINFGKLLVEAEIDKFVNYDARKEIGNALHRFAVTIPTADLARVIYHSEGEVEVPQECLQEMMDIISKNFFVFITRAIKNEIDKQLNNKEE